MLLRRGGRVPDNAHQSINAVIIHVALPAVTLRLIHGFVFDAGHLWPVLMPWALFAIGAVVFWALGRWLLLPRTSVGALTLRCCCGRCPFRRPSNAALARVGDTLAPLALLSIGLHLRFDALRAHARLLGLGLSYKLMVCPAVVVGLLWLLDAESGTIPAVSVIEAAMPPMIGAGVVAAQAKLDAPLVSTMIGIGTPLGLSTAAAWHWLFGALVV